MHESDNIEILGERERLIALRGTFQDENITRTHTIRAFPLVVIVISRFSKFATSNI